MTRISLCLIAKNEARLLPECLASAKPFVDEMVVVDTGSTDETVALAEAAGARVIHHPWHDNFSAARNAALAEAHGDWILLLDADERLQAKGLPILRHAIEQELGDCLELPLYDAQNLTVAPDQWESHPHLFKKPVYLKRVFRRTPDLRWQGAIHENVAAWLGQRPIVRVEAPIVHYGNVPELREARDKNARNLAILEKEYRARPDDLHILSYYLLERFRHTRDEKTLDLAKEAWRKLATVSAAIRNRLVSVVTIYVWFFADAGEEAQVMSILDQAREWGMEHPHLNLTRGNCQERVALKTWSTLQKVALCQAEIAYRETLAAHKRHYTAEVTWGTTSWIALAALGRILLRMFQATEAVTLFENADRVLAEAGGHDEITPQRLQVQLGLIHALAVAGDHKRALRLIRKNKALPPEDMALLRAETYERSGNFKACFNQLETLAQKEVTFIYGEGSLVVAELLAVVNLYRGVRRAGKGSVGTLAAVLGGARDVYEPGILDQDRLLRVFSVLRQQKGRAEFRPFEEPTVRSYCPQLSKLVMTFLEQQP